MALGNFTVTDINFEVPEFVDISTIQSGATITITPDKGYVIDASDFSLRTPIPSLIDANASVFNQAGQNIELVLVFNSETMPSNNLEVPICVAGFDQLIAITVSGTWSASVINATSAINGVVQVSGSYSGNGELGTTEEVISDLKLTADANYFFNTIPVATVNTGVEASYSIIRTDVYTGLNITESSFDVSYTFPSNNVTGDFITFTGNAIAVPSTQVYINAYSMNTSNVSAGGENRSITITGNTGANYTLKIENTAGTGIVLDAAGVIDSSGSVSFTAVFPTVTADQTYEVTFGGDLNPALIGPTAPQDDQFLLTQELAMTLTVSLTSADPNITIISASSNETTLVPSQNYSPPNTQNIGLEVVAAPGYTITPTTPAPTVQDFLPQDELNGDLNGGTYWDIQNLSAQVVSTTIDTYKVTFVQSLVSTGTNQDVAVSLDVDNFITVQTAPAIPSISTGPVQLTSSTEVKTSGVNLAENGSAISSKGIYLKDAAGGMIQPYQATPATGTADFLIDITGLTPSTGYIAQAYAQNSSGVGTGADVAFTTPSNSPSPGVPTVTTTQATNTTVSSFDTGGNAVSYNGGTPVANGIQFSLISGGPYQQTAGGVPSNGAWAQSITGLTAATTYYYRAYVQNSFATGFGQELSVTTSQLTPTPGLTSYLSSTNFQTSTLNICSNLATNTSTFHHDGQDANPNGGDFCYEDANGTVPLADGIYVWGAENSRGGWYTIDSSDGGNQAVGDEPGFCTNGADLTAQNCPLGIVNVTANLSSVTDASPPYGSPPIPVTVTGTGQFSGTPGTTGTTNVTASVDIEQGDWLAGPTYSGASLLTGTVTWTYGSATQNLVVAVNGTIRQATGRGYVDIRKSNDPCSETSYNDRYWYPTTDVTICTNSERRANSPASSGTQVFTSAQGYNSSWSVGSYAVDDNGTGCNAGNVSNQSISATGIVGNHSVCSPTLYYVEISTTAFSSASAACASTAPITLQAYWWPDPNGSGSGTLEASEPAPAGTTVYDSATGLSEFYGQGYYLGGENNTNPDVFQQQINNLGVVSDWLDC
jgi:hypothetical protein